MLELKGICVSFRRERQDKLFGHTRRQVLFDVSFSVREGSCLGILGESGSGKSERAAEERKRQQNRWPPIMES